MTRSLDRRQFLTGRVRSDACPVGFFDQSDRASHHVITIGDPCLARRGIVCESCRDACPEAAIRFTPRRGGPFVPEVVTALCTGCGACLSTCPTSAIRLANLTEAPNA